MKLHRIILGLALITFGISMSYPELLWARKTVAAITRPFSPGWGSCGRCGRTWNIAKSHDTMYSSFEGCFPLCEPCWKGLTPATRLPYYRAMIAMWEWSRPVSEVKKAAIIAVVEAGK